MKVKITAPKLVKYMTVPQASTKGDAMSGYYVWAVKDNKAVKKNIKVSDAIDNNWVVNSRLNLDDTIVLSGIQSRSRRTKIKTYTKNRRKSSIIIYKLTGNIVYEKNI